MDNNEEKNLVDRINDIEWNKFLNYATIVSLAMVAFYALGAYKHWKEIKRLK